MRYAAWAVIGIVLGAAYLLWLYQRVMFGPVTNPANEHLPDLNLREYATLVPLVILAFWIGIYPKPLFTVLEQPVHQIVAQANPDYYRTAQITAPANGQLAAAASQPPLDQQSPMARVTAAAARNTPTNKYLALAANTAAGILAGGNR
jgi:NADH-quinone oxidoreductase subunit M